MELDQNKRASQKKKEKFASQKSEPIQLDLPLNNLVRKSEIKDHIKSYLLHGWE